MNYHIDQTMEIPAYLQLYHAIRQDIIQGVYTYDSRLPSKRTMAGEVGVSVITVEHAMQLLSDEGYVEMRQRSGAFVIYKSADFQGVPGNESEDLPASPVLESWEIGEFPYSVYAKTMRKVLADFGDQIFVKGPNKGSMALRHEISSYLARSRNIIADPEQIVIGAGAEYLYTMIAQLLGREHAFALEDPSYEKIRRVYEASGIRCEMLPLTKEGIASQSLERSMADVLHVTPFNSFPSGISINASKKQEYLQFVQGRKGYLIEDNYDSELTVSKKAEDSLFSMSKFENVIYMNTFSKTIAPSVRIGYMILPKMLMQEYESKLGFYSCTVPLFEQYVLKELLRSGDFERHVNRVRRKRRKMHEDQVN